VSSVFDLFERLRRESFSGEVEVTSSQGHAIILLKEGKFVWAHRTIDRAFERFQKVSWLQMPSAAQVASGRSWGDFVVALLEANPDSYNRIVRLLKMDRLEVFFRIFFWSNLEMIQRTVDVHTLLVPPELSFYSVREFEPLLIEARKRVADWPDMKIRMGSSRRIFMSQVEPSSLKIDYDAAVDEPSIAPASPDNGQLPQVPFSSEEIEMLRHCDGRNTVQDLVRTLPEGEFLIVRRLLDLWRKGAVRPKDDEESVVSIHARADDISPRDIIGASAVAFLVSLGFLLAGHIFIAPPPAAVPHEIQQALVIYRRTEGHYPATLTEIPSRVFLTRNTLKKFDYTLADPMHFDVKPKAAR
jgi:hypothetical protein